MRTTFPVFIILPMVRPICFTACNIANTSESHVGTRLGESSPEPNMAGSGVLERFEKWFWNEDIWLPKNFTWENIARSERVNYAQFSDLNYGFLVALALLVIRFVLDKVIYSPLGIYLGLKANKQKKKAPENALLERAFRANGRIGYKQIQGLAKQLDWAERKVERWLRQRNMQEKPTTLSKFTESAWRFTFYCTGFGYGLYTLSDKPWLWDTRHCWYDYPHHNVTPDIWRYYMLEIGFYWSLIFSQFLDVRRKDFLQMFVHHVVTVLLLGFSWACNLTRIGTLVLVIHDFADCPLEAAKMATYLRRQKLSNSLFFVFLIIWIISRLGLFPYRVIYSTLFEAINIVEIFPAYYIFNSLLCALQVLHVLWTWMIFRVAFHAFTKKEVKDLRSEEESSNESSGVCQNDVGIANHKAKKNLKS